MQWIGILGLGAPVVCVLALVLVAFVQGVFLRRSQKRNPQGQFRRAGATYALSTAFLCLSIFYRPQLELAVKARIQRQEQQDEDDQGDPESPLRQLLRQLRSIRRGEAVDRLVWRLE
jgi:hypothetical protein